MTISATEIAAVVGGVDVDVEAGSLALDAGQAPHVQGEITTPLSAAVLAAVDPRSTVAPRVSITAGGREFDLHVRSRGIRYGAGTITFPVASDEGLLDDHAPLADDSSAYFRQGSLRDIVNYVLGAAIPGAALAASPSVDANMTPYADSVNLITNPAVPNLNGYTASNATQALETVFKPSGVQGVYIGSPTSADSYVTFDAGSGMRVGMIAGRTYVFSATGSVRSAIGGGGPRARKIVAFVTTPSGTVEYQSPAIPATVESGNSAGTRVSVKFTVPANATAAFVRFYHGGTSGGIAWSNPRLSEYTGDPADIAFFYGATGATAGYSYAWTGTGNASTSKRTALIERSVDMLMWKAGVSALRFLMPLVQSQGLRLVCDEQRVWTLRDETYTAPGSLNLRYGVNIVDADDDIDRAGGEWFDARVTRYTWTDANGAQQVRTDAYALTTPYARLSLLDIAAPYPGPGRSEYAVRRAQGRGRVLTVTRQADWDTSAEQAASVTLPDTPALIGNLTSVRFELERNEMTVSLRAEEVPAGSVNLLLGTVDALVGTVNNL